MLKVFNKKWLRLAFIALALLALSWIFRPRTTCCSEHLSAKEIAELTAAAERGDVKAMSRLSLFLYESGGMKEEQQARYWLQQGADHGDPEAESHVASLLLEKENPVDQQSGVKYLMSAANHGLPRAQVALGKLYLEGKLVPKNDALAEEWFRKNAVTGDLSGMLALVDMLAARAQTKAELAECLSWISKALASPDIKPAPYYLEEFLKQKERVLQKAKTAGFIIS